MPATSSMVTFGDGGFKGFYMDSLRPQASKEYFEMQDGEQPFSLDDVVLIDPDARLESGKLCVVTWPGSGTSQLRRYYQDSERVALKPVFALDVEIELTRGHCLRIDRVVKSITVE